MMNRFILVCGLLFATTASAAAQWGGGAKPTAAPANPAVAEIDALREAVAKAWLKSPLTWRRALFVRAPSPMFGAFEPRDGNVFKPGEKLITYVEPIGYVWKPTGDAYEFGVSVDFIIKGADGKILAGQEKFGEFLNTSHEKPQEFMLNLTLSLDGAAPGDYVLRYTLHDLGGAKTATIEQPFVIAN